MTKVMYPVEDYIMAYKLNFEGMQTATGIKKRKTRHT